MEIRLLNGEIAPVGNLEEKMNSDEYYYSMGVDKCLSYSSLSTLLRSPYEFYNQHLSKIRKENKSYSTGRATHCMLLEEHKFFKRYFVSDFKTKNCKAYKEDLSNNSEKEVLTASEFNYVQTISDRVNKYNGWQYIVKDSDFEVPRIREIQGIPIRAKADILKGSKEAIDFKTTSDIHSFERSCYKYNYDLQAYIYSEIFEVDEFMFFVVDKSSLEISKFYVDDDFLDSGKNKFNKAIEIYINTFLEKQFDPYQFCTVSVL